MNRGVVLLAGIVALSSAVHDTAFAAGPIVVAYELPDGYSVAPEAESRQLTINTRGSITAIATEIGGSDRRLALRWDPSGARSTFDPLNVATSPDPTYRGSISAEAVAANRLETYVTVGTAWSGAYSGFSTEAQRWLANGARRWPLPACVEAGWNGDEIVRDIDEFGNVALTMEITGKGGYLIDRDPPLYAPYAFVINGDHCRDLGHGVINGVRGAWAAGTRGYLGQQLAPPNLNSMIQRTVAVRWHDEKLSELGIGDAEAIAADGFAVGADAIPGHFESMATNFFTGAEGRVYTSGVPHALAWNVDGSRIVLNAGGRRSVAYDVSDDHTIVGLVVGADGKHHAFRWRNGRMERLDDLPHPAGWRFESAYAVGSDGTIAGIGTLNGIPTIFTWRD